jgi:hypothetical protein
VKNELQGKHLLFCTFQRGRFEDVVMAHWLHTFQSLCCHQGVAFITPCDIIILVRCKSLLLISSPLVLRDRHERPRSHSRGSGLRTSSFLCGIL